MKKILLVACFIVLALTSKVKAQCDIVFQNLQLSRVTAVDLPNDGCQVTFDASFDIIANSGFKYLFFHSWVSQDYPNPPIFDCSHNTPAVWPGTAVQYGTSLVQSGTSFLDFGFINLKDLTDTVTQNVTTDITSFIATEFPHDATVALTQPSNMPGMMAFVSVSGDTLHFEVTSITITSPVPCAAPVVVLTDIWGSNSNAKDPKAQCYVCAEKEVFNDPTITGFINCNLPRQYSINISTVDTAQAAIQYLVYVDMNGNGQINPNVDSLAFISDTINISAPGGSLPDSYSSGFVSLPPPYSTTAPYISKAYLVTVRYVFEPNRRSTVAVLAAPQGCIGLPANFRSFTAIRTNRTNVFLKWETITEQNVSGFVVERNTTGKWEQVIFVPTQALDGSSNSLLTYQLNDLNGTKGISQYRIREIEKDGTAKISDIRSVRGEGQKGSTIVYPNPSSDGRVNVVFEGDLGKRSISIQDISGRVIRQWNNYTNNNLQIENLAPGFYTIRIIDIETGYQDVEKVVVNKR